MLQPGQLHLGGRRNWRYIVKSLHRTRSFLIVFLSQGLAHDVCLRPIWSHQELANKLNPDTPAVKREAEEDWGH
jgi:hypothetical protein